METEQPQVLLAYCKGLFELRIILRMRRALAARNWRVVTVTERLSVWLFSRGRGIDSLLLRRVRDSELCPPPLPEGTKELALKTILVPLAREFQKSMWTALQKMCGRHSIQVIVMFNGLHVAGRAAKSFATARGIPMIHFEMGNIERNLFADPEGVNAEASVAIHPELLDEFRVSDAEMLSWRDKYLESQKISQVPPQARRLRHLNPWYLLDWCGFRFFGVPSSERISLIAKVGAKMRLWDYRQVPPTAPDRPYIFLPLQVSTDTNLILFSSYDNLSALKFASKRAAEHKCLLVVKPHPAEENTSLLKKIAELCAEREHLLTSYNTTELVKGAEEVITINSTVGLEAKLLDKPLIVLGRSLYGRFNMRQAYAFVMRYLVDFKPHDKKVASQAAVDQILGMIKKDRDRSS